MGGTDSRHPAQASNQRLAQCQLPSAASMRRRVQNTRTRHNRQTRDLNHGKPSTAVAQLVELLANTITPKSFETYRSPFESRTISVAGKSGNAVPPGLSRDVHVASFAPWLYVTSNTWPGWLGVLKLYLSTRSMRGSDLPDRQRSH